MAMLQQTIASCAMIIMIVSFWNNIMSSSTAMLLDFAAHTSSCQSASASNSDLYAALQQRKQQLRTSCAAMQHLTGCAMVLESCRQLVYSRLNWFPALRSSKLTLYHHHREAVGVEGLLEVKYSRHVAVVVSERHLRRAPRQDAAR